MPEWTVITEAESETNEHGRAQVSAGWFITNIAEIRAIADPGENIMGRLESTQARFADYGVNVQIVYPGHANCKYHREDAQESILVLDGEGLLIVEEQERPLKQWDFVHLPAGTAHVLVGAGDGPCVVLFMGARGEDRHLHYPVSEVAGRYGASVAVATDDPQVAYADEPEPVPMRMPWPTQ
jgi:uncharacterized cupin superfamily protein